MLLDSSKLQSNRAKFKQILSFLIFESDQLSYFPYQKANKHISVQSTNPFPFSLSLPTPHPLSLPTPLHTLPPYSPLFPYSIIYKQNIKEQKMGCSHSIDLQTPPNYIDGHRNNKKNKNFRRNSVDLTEEITEQIQILSNKLNDAQLHFAVQKLQHHQLFSSLSRQELKVVCEEMVHAKSMEGKYLFKQGEIGSCFFLIYKGKVDVEIDGKLVRTLEKGHSFGELALLFRTARSASIACQAKNCEFLIMKPALYRKTLQKMKLEEESRNSEAVKAVPMFSCLTNKQKYSLASTIKIMVYHPGDVIFKAGDDAQAMYIISQGSIRIEIQGKNDILIKSGEIFGQASLEENMKRSGTATAITKAVCSIISRKDIQNCLGSSINNLKFYNTKKWALMRSATFRSLDINQIITEFQLFHVKDNTLIDPLAYEGFIICLEGKINNTQQGVVFNEQNWINKTYKCAKLVKDGDGYCGFLSFKRAQLLFQSINNKKKVVKLYKKEGPKNNIYLKDFQYLKKLGEGQFGQVFLVKNVQYGTNLYAIKCLSKQQIKKEQMQLSVLQEKQILEKTIFPYIVGFVKAFHDKNYVFLLMQYIHGKEMFDVIREIKTMSLTMVRYYFACLMVSIEYLHSNSVVYRDLKPENSVIDYKGKVYLIDLGTAKELTAETFYKTFTIIGTPHYMAPQVFQGNGYSFEVDLWSLGCLLYQFLCFGLPFGESAAGDPYAVYTAIKKYNVTYPKFMKDDNAKNLINSLLVKNPKQRGNLTFQKIKSHDFFKGFDWASLMDETMQGPYIPKQFRHYSVGHFNDIVGKDLLKHIYKSERHFEIEQWNGSV